MGTICEANNNGKIRQVAIIEEQPSDNYGIYVELSCMPACAVHRQDNSIIPGYISFFVYQLDCVIHPNRYLGLYTGTFLRRVR